MVRLLYLIVLALVPLGVIGAIILFLFRKSLYSRLSTRIAVLIFASGPAALVVLVVFRNFLREAGALLGVSQISQIAFIVLGGSVVLGLLAARYVQRPLRQFNDAIDSLEQSNYRVKLQPTGIHEFDEVFTKFNNLTRRLQREEKLRKDLVSDTSHELNTPLATMIGQLTAMQEGKHSVTEERIITLKEQAERLAELVQQLDAYTKARMPDSRKQEVIHIKQLCKQLIGHFHIELDRKGIVTKLDIADDLTIHADRDILQRILTNLIQNTLRYSEASELTITATPRQLTFSDNGKGVPPESLPYLFERFYRVDKSRSRNTGGLGLGLAIVRELTEGQGWQIKAELVHPGLIFTLSFAESSE